MTNNAESRGRRLGPRAAFQRIRTTGLGLAMLGVLSTTAGAHPVVDGAHPEATLKSDVSSVTAGGTLPLSGSEFVAGEGYALRLLGALSEYDLLDEVMPNAEGLFTIQVEIPRDVRPGEYQVIAVAPDGDVSARLDLMVLAAMPEETHDAESQADDGAMAHDEGGARADEISIERSRSGIEWGAIGLLIGVAGGFGVGLVRRAA